VKPTDDCGLQAPHRFVELHLDVAAAIAPTDILPMTASTDCLCRGPKKCGRCHLVALARARAEAPRQAAPKPAVVAPLGGSCRSA
jgi:hypothetical protein